MRVEHGLAVSTPVDAAAAPAVVTIGNFDGVHRGHRAILERVVGGARALGGEAAAVTFEPHPRCVLTPDACPARLCGAAEREERLADLGLDRLVVLPFDLEVSRWSAASFCDRLQATFGLRRLVVGPGFALGHRRQGDVAFLRGEGASRGFDVEVAEPLLDGGEPVSSTRVRRALEAGDVETAARLLGRHWELRGEVRHGDRRGAGLGFPTANLEAVPGAALPAAGVYACWALAAGRWRLAATSVGMRPTFGGGRLVVEPHLLDFAGDLYGGELRCAFVARLREERVYASADELVEQMHADVAETRRQLAGAPPPPR